MQGLVPFGPDDPLWWKMRRAFRPLAYHAARAMFDGRTPPPAPGGRCILCGILRLTASRVTRASRSATCNGYWVISLSRPRKFTSFRRPRMLSRARWPITAGRQNRSRAGLPGRRRFTVLRAWTCCSARAAGDRRGVGQGGCPALAAQLRGSGRDGEVPASPGPGRLGPDGRGPVRGGPADARAAVPRRRREGPVLAEAGHAEDPGLARPAPGDDMAGTVGGLRRWCRRDRRLAGPDAGRPGGRRQPRAAGQADPQRARYGHGPADRRRHPAAVTALAAGHRIPRPP